MLFFSGQFSKNFNIFKGAWRWYPLKNFQFFGFLNQVNVYLGKVTNFRGILSNRMWRNSKIPLGGVESTPPWLLGLTNKIHTIHTRAEQNIFHAMNRSYRVNYFLQKCIIFEGPTTTEWWHPTCCNWLSIWVSHIMYQTWVDTKLKMVIETWKGDMKHFRDESTWNSASTQAVLL